MNKKEMRMNEHEGEGEKERKRGGLKQSGAF